MGIEALAVVPAGIGIVALVILIFFKLTNVRRLFQALLVSIALSAGSAIMLIATVFVTEFLGLSIIGEPLCFATVGFIIYFGLRLGRKIYGFNNENSIKT